MLRLPRFLLLFLVATTLSASSWFTTGPDGGRVNALALEPLSGRLFIGTDNGLFISSDGAATFTRIHNVEQYEVTNIAIDPKDPAALWVIYGQMETLSPIVLRQTRLFRSLDGGTTWTEETAFGSLKSISDLELDADGTAYVSFRCGVELFKTASAAPPETIAHSPDRGRSWWFGAGTPSERFRCMRGVTPDREQPGVVWAHSWTQTVLPVIDNWRSTDGGVSFMTTSSAYTPGRSLLIHPATKRRFAIVGGGTISDYGAVSDPSSVVVSDDGGATWRPMPLPPGLTNPIVAAIALDPASPDALYLALNSGLYRTTDLGATWERLLDDATYAIVVTPSRVYAGTAAGLRVGPSLVTIDDDATTSLEVQVDPNDPTTVYAWMGDVEQKVWIARSRDAGTTWERIADGFGDVKPYFPGPRPRLGVGGNGAVYALQVIDPQNHATIARLGPGETTWQRFPYPDVAPYVLVADPTAAGTLYVFAFGPLMRKSTDGGATWSDAVALPHGNFQSITRAAAIDPVDPRILFISTDDGILRSIDGGQSWAIVNLASLSSISISPADHRIIWADRLKSTDGGTTWSTMPMPLSGNHATTADRNDRDTVYVWGSGVYRSGDGGRTWLRFDDGITSPLITWLTAAPNALYAATSRRGVFTRTFQRRRAVR